MKMKKRSLFIIAAVLLIQMQPTRAMSKAIPVLGAALAQGAVGGVIAHQAVKAIEQFIAHIAQGTLARINPHRLEGINLKELRKIAGTMDAKEIHEWLVKARKAKAQSKPKSLKDRMCRMFGHQGFEKPGAPLTTTDGGDPIRDKHGEKVYMPYLEPTSWLCSGSDVCKKNVPYIKAALIPLGIWIGIRNSKQAQAKAAADRAAFAIDRATDRAALIRDIAEATRNAAAVVGATAGAKAARAAMAATPPTT